MWNRWTCLSFSWKRIQSQRKEMVSVHLKKNENISSFRVHPWASCTDYFNHFEINLEHPLQLLQSLLGRAQLSLHGLPADQSKYLSILCQWWRVVTLSFIVKLNVNVWIQIKLLVFVFVFVFVFTVLLVKSAILPTCAWSPPPSASSGSCPGSLVSSATPGQQHWPMRSSQKQKQFNIFNIEPENESSTLISPSRASRSPLSSSTSSFSCVLSCRLCSRLTWWGWESPHWLYGWRWWDLLVELYQCS